MSENGNGRTELRRLLTLKLHEALMEHLKTQPLGEVLNLYTALAQCVTAPIRFTDQQETKAEEPTDPPAENEEQKDE